MKVLIIGSGLSGLTSAALLAKEGHDVIVFEQHEKVGGVTATLMQDGYKWDWGQMLIPDLSFGEPGRAVLEKLGISDKVNTIKGYREIFFPDFYIRRPEKFKGIYWRKEYFKKLFPEDSKGIQRYYKIYERIHDLSGLLNKSGLFSKIKLLLKFIPVMGKKNWSAQKLMDYCFSNKKLQAVFSGILADYVAPPEIFPGLIIPIINAESQYDERVPLNYGEHEHKSSWCFIENGCIELVNAIAEALIRFGGRIITNIAVLKILIQDNKVKNILTSDGKMYKTDAIVASGGAKELFLDLIGEKQLPKDFLKTYINELFTTESVFMVHLGVDYDPSVHQNNAALCYYYLTYDINESIKECQKGIYHEGKDGFLIYIPSVHSPDMAPPGHHAVTVYTIAPNTPINGNWDENKEEWAEKLLEIVEKYVPGLREHTKIKIILTPEDFKKRTYLKHHAFGGSVPHLTIPPPPHKTPIKGLWFVGAQSETYGGVIGAITGADNVVKMMLKDKASKKTTQTFKSFSK